jgi:hypothetical protein
MWGFPDHPEIECCLRTGYPSWMQEGDTQEIDEDSLYEERRERDLFGEE